MATNDNLEVKTVQSDAVFRIFTASAKDQKVFLLDVRPNKSFTRKHVMQAYNIRLSADGKALLDYSKNSYDISWSQGVWWDRTALVYGDEGLKRDHPVVSFLLREKRARAVLLCKEGYDAIERRYPFICSQSVKANAFKCFPAEVLPRLLFLGDWSHAQAVERLDELNIKRVITIHNSPEQLKLPPRFKHLCFTLADVETEDISPCFAPTYAFVDEAEAAGHAVLIHCGAGVSRSASLVIAVLMRRQRTSAAKARKAVVERRSVAAPNDGFWRTLCALEGELGITDRSDPNAVTGGSGADALVTLSEDAAGEKVVVRFVPATTSASVGEPVAGGGVGARDEQRQGGKQGAADKARGLDVERQRKRDGGRDHDSERERKRERRERSRERERGSGRGGDREREQDRGRKRASEEAGAGNGSLGRGAEQVGKAEPPQGPPPALILEVVREGQTLGAWHVGHMKPSQALVFGRMPSCDIMLEHMSISRQHAQLQMDRLGNVTLMDLGSAHGTNVDDVWVRPNMPRQLSKGSAFKFGASSRTFRVAKLPARG